MRRSSHVDWWSAPKFTEGDEDKEQKGLSPDERVEIENDMFGLGTTTASSHEETSIDTVQRQQEQKEQEAQEQQHEQEQQESPINKQQQQQKHTNSRQRQQEQQQCNNDDEKVPVVISWELLDNEIDKIPLERRQALNQALRTCPEMIDADHKLMFLRWAEFDFKKAAARLVTYWEDRLKLFQEVAFLPMTQSMALAEDASSVSIGLWNLLPHKDTSGRAIIFVDTSLQDRSKYKLDSMLRAIWYELHCCVRDEEVQTNGIVAVIYDEKTVLSQFDRKLYKRILNAVNHSLPVKIKAIHQCHPNRYINLVLPVAKFLLGRFLRGRFKMHKGTKAKVLGELEEYGIEPWCMPHVMGGTLDCDRLEILNMRSRQEVNMNNNEESQESSPRQSKKRIRDEIAKSA